jgi:RNA polymerase sigma-70 factor (sigma-E family)
MRSFEDFVETDIDSLLRFGQVLCGERQLAQDVVQEVLLRAQMKWPYIGAQARPTAYVRRMIVNEYLSWRRKWARIIPMAELPVHPSSPDHAQAIGDRDLVVTELARLPKRQRTVLVLRYYTGLTDREIAAEMGCAASTVRSHAARALAALRVELSTSPLHVSEGNRHAY